VEEDWVTYPFNRAEVELRFVGAPVTTETDGATTAG
jgi:hypothetical protein